MKTIYAGTRVRVTCEFYPLSSNILTDPLNVTVEVTSPSGVVTSKSWPADVALVKDAVGVFHYDIDANAAGVWKYHWFSTGLVKTATRGEFKVSP